MQSTKKIIQQYYTAFNNGNLIEFIDLLHDEVIHDINQGEREVGKEKFTAFMKHMDHCYKEKITNLIIMSSEDNIHAAAEFIVEGIYIATDTGLPPAKNQSYSLAAGAFFEMKDEKIYRVTNYYNLNDWLKQVSVK